MVLTATEIDKTTLQNTPETSKQFKCLFIHQCLFLSYRSTIVCQTKMDHKEHKVSLPNNEVHEFLEQSTDDLTVKHTDNGKKYAASK